MSDMPNCVMRSGELTGEVIELVRSSELTTHCADPTAARGTEFESDAAVVSQVDYRVGSVS